MVDGMRVVDVRAYVPVFCVILVSRQPRSCSACDGGGGTAEYKHKVKLVHA